MKSKMDNFVHSKESYEELFNTFPEDLLEMYVSEELNLEFVSDDMYKSLNKAKKKRAAKVAKETLKGVFVFMKSYKYSLIWMVIINLLATGLTIGGIFLLQEFQQLLQTQGQPDTWMTLSVGVGTLFAVYLLTLIFGSIQTWGLVKISQQTGEKIRSALFEKIQKLPVSFFDRNSSGDLMSRFTNDVNNVTKSLSENFGQLLTALSMGIGMTIGMFIMSPILALIAFAMVPIMLFVMLKITKRAQPLYKRQQTLIGKINGFSEEMISGQNVINLFNHQERIKKEFKKLSDETTDVAYKTNNLNSYIFPWVIFFQNFIVYFVTFMGIILIITDSGLISPILHPNLHIGSPTDPNFMVNLTTTITMLTTFSLFLRNFLQPFTQLSNTLASIQAAFAGASRSFEVFEVSDEFNANEKLILKLVDSIQSTRKQNLDNNKEENVVITESNLTIKNLDFSYLPEKQILKNINLKVKKGQTIAIVGPTGSGKSTIINLLTKFYDIEKGDILLGDKHSIKEITKESMRNNVSIVLQDTFLFNESIKDNIKMANLNATDEEVVEAAKVAEADDFIMKMPNGYDTILDDNGDGLSLGQKQLLAIARAVLSRSEILILDEATSSVDTKTEAKIQKAMMNLTKDKTSFVIAHRLSTIEKADVILVLKDGEIIEQGSHNKLLEEKGFYANLYNSQFTKGVMEEE